AGQQNLRAASAGRTRVLGCRWHAVLPSHDRGSADPRAAEPSFALMADHDIPDRNLIPALQAPGYARFNTDVSEGEDEVGGSSDPGKAGSQPECCDANKQEIEKLEEELDQAKNTIQT